MGFILLFSEDTMPDYQFRSPSGIPSSIHREMVWLDSSETATCFAISIVPCFFSSLEAWDCQHFLHSEFIIFVNWPDWRGDTKAIPKVQYQSVSTCGFWPLRTWVRHPSLEERDFKNIAVLGKYLLEMMKKDRKYIKWGRGARLSHCEWTDCWSGLYAFAQMGQSKI